MKFTEAQLETAIIELLAAGGYPHVLGEALGERSSSCVSSSKDGAGAPSLPEVLIKADQRVFLSTQYPAEQNTPQETGGSRHHSVVRIFQTTDSDAKSYHLPQAA